MAVDQLRNLNFFKEMLSTGNICNNNNNNIVNSMMLNQIIGNNNSLPANGDSRFLLPFYNLNDVVFNSGKLPPAAKDDSGVTFNNSIPAVTSSRKRAREQTVFYPSMIGGPALLTSNAGSSSIISKEFESNCFSFLGQDLSLQIMQQQLELDRLVSQHMEKMKIEMEEQKKQQLRKIMASIQDTVSKKMREKDDEISKLVKINIELEDKAKTLHLQSQIWRDVAHTNEATANALRSNLEQVLHQIRQNEVVTDYADDAASYCGSSGYGGNEEEEERWPKRRGGNDGERWVYRGKKLGEGENGGKRMCKKCGQGESTVLILPCRHLCLCTICGPIVNACPICDSVRNASIHVNLS